MRTLTVSRATAGFLGRGHPWVRPDRFTRGLEQLRCGEPVTLVDQQGRRLASALADPGAGVCARVYAWQPDQPFAPAQALLGAWQRRGALHADPSTTCYRVVHGEADGLPGVRIERYGELLVVLLTTAAAAVHADALAAAAQALLPEARVLVRLHREDLRRANVEDRPWGGWRIDPQAVLTATELDVRYPLRPFAGLATGLYVDQRGTRLALRAQAAGARVLNLFAYTGAFSLALLRAGAQAALDVDRSGPALARAREAAVLNGVHERHRTVQDDCRVVLSQLAKAGERFDLVICDPPTAAQGGEGWVLTRDYPALLTQAWAVVEPGGLLVTCANTLHRPVPLAAWVEAAVGREGIAVAPPPWQIDLPQRQGFPEGRPYQLVLRRRRAAG